MTTAIRSEATRSVVVVNGNDHVYVNSDGSIEAVSPPAVASGNQLVSMGQSKLSRGVAQATTSGTYIDFTGIPSWVNRITVMFGGVSTGGTSSVQLQLGSGSVKTSGYLGAVWHAATTVNHSTGFLTGVDGGAGYLRQGFVTLARLDSLTWTIAGVIGLSDSARVAGIGGAVTLSDTLDRIRLTTVNGTDVFDAGSVNIAWE